MHSQPWSLDGCSHIFGQSTSRKANFNVADSAAGKSDGEIAKNALSAERGGITAPSGAESTNVDHQQTRALTKKIKRSELLTSHAFESIQDLVSSPWRL